MPIRQRKSISTKKRKAIAAPKKLVVAIAKKKPKTKKTNVTEVAVLAMPEPVPAKHSFIKKRKSPKDKLIYIDPKGLLVVRTPQVYSKWPHEFRLRIIKDYVPPRTLKLLTEFQRTFLNDERQETVYRLQDKNVMVRQPYKVLADNTNYVVVLRTEIIDVEANKAMFLCHEDPTMRGLMAYSFISGVTVAGMPKFDVYDVAP